MHNDRKDTVRNKYARRLRLYRLLFLRKVRRLAPHHSLHWVLIVAVIVPLVTLDGCSIFSKKPKTIKPPAVPVLAAQADEKNVPVYLSALGSVIPVETVTIMTQINGQLLRVHFIDGQMVKAGDLLAEIDPRPYQALLMQYEGQLIRDKALLANARIDLQRYQTLYEQDSISEQTLATQQSLVQQYIGAIKTDQGQIDAAKVDLIYCKITAPISGRVGLLQVDPGNFVQTSNTTGIVVLNSMDPIYVDFAIPEDHLPGVALKMAEGKPLTVYAQDRTQNRTLAVGVLKTTDNQIDTSTGTITLRAQFANANNILFPNQFVNVLLQTDELQNAVVIPTEAIQYGINGSYVFVLNNDMTVTMKPIKVLAATGDQTAISSDITAGQSVIIEGMDKLKDGSLVTVLKPADPPAKKGATSSESI